MPNTISADTYWMPKGSVERRWYVVDLQDQILGRASSQIARVLMGKTKPTYTPSTDCGDFVIVINADKFRVTGDKLNQKISFHHTAHPGGGRSVPYGKLVKEKPEKAIFISIKKMLPKNKLASRQILRLKIYKKGTHPHAVQNPVILVPGH